MSAKVLRNLTSIYNHACFHVFFQRVSRQVCTGQKSNFPIGDSNLCVDFAICEGCCSVSPSKKSCGRNVLSHGSDWIYRETAAMRD